MIDLRGKIAYHKGKKVDKMYLAGEEIYNNVQEDYSEFLATDADFSGETDGSFKYIGNAKTVYIPHVIKGVPVSSYNYMFMQTSVERVISDNPNITRLIGTFANTTAQNLDLSTFDTSNVENINSLFYSSKVKNINLDNFDTSNVISYNTSFRRTEAEVLDLTSFNINSGASLTNMFLDSSAREIIVNSEETISRLKSSANVPVGAEVLLPRVEDPRIEELLSLAKITNVDSSKYRRIEELIKDNSLGSSLLHQEAARDFIFRNKDLWALVPAVPDFLNYINSNKNLFNKYSEVISQTNREGSKYLNVPGIVYNFDFSKDFANTLTASVITESGFREVHKQSSHYFGIDTGYRELRIFINTGNNNNYRDTVVKYRYLDFSK